MLYPIQNKTRDLVCLDGLWQFEAQGKTQELAVPASWNEQDSDLYNYLDVATYTKKAFVPQHFAGRKVWLRFGAVNPTAVVKVNGKLAGEHRGVSLPFEFDVTALIAYGEENLFEVFVDNRLDPWALPPATLEAGEGRIGFHNSYPAVAYDFYPFGGIHRSVYLYTTADTRIQNIKIDAGMDGVAQVRVVLSQKFTGTLRVSSAEVTAVCTLTDVDVVDASLTVDDAKLWDVGQPNLYDMVVELLADDTLVDT